MKSKKKGFAAEVSCHCAYLLKGVVILQPVPGAENIVRGWSGVFS